MLRQQHVRHTPAMLSRGSAVWQHYAEATGKQDGREGQTELLWFCGRQIDRIDSLARSSLLTADRHGQCVLL